MKKLFFCNLLYIKRCFKKISFMLLLLAIPVLCMILKNSTDTDDSTIRAGLYIEENSEIAQEISKNLTKDYTSVVFEICPDLNTLKKKVASKTYECGYVFTDGFQEKINNCETKEIMKVYVSPSTISSALTNEYVFAEIFKIYAIRELMDYIENDESFKNKDISDLEETVIPIYENYLAGDSTFTFEYINPNDSNMDNTSLFNSYVLMSVKGVIALLIMFASFMGTLNLYKDNKIGIFYAFNGITKTFAKMSEIFSVTILAAISGLITIYLCGLSDGLFTEIYRLIAYSLICTLYCYLIYKLVPNQYIFTSLIPILILGSIIFCPIFIDFSEIIPFVKYMSWMFAPKYYFVL